MRTIKDTAIYEAAVSVATFVAGLRERAPLDAAGASMLALWGPIAARVERELLALQDADVQTLEPGDTFDLELRVRATVLDRSDAHGVCYELELERRDYYAGRIVCVDEDEIALASPA